MVEGNFLVPSEKDELQGAIDYWEEIEANDEKYELHINPTVNCNFNCWYCFETHEKRSRMGPEVQARLVELTRRILNEMPNLKYFEVKWFGGEPLLVYEQSLLPLFSNIQKTIEEFNLKNGRPVVLRSYITTNGLLLKEDVINEFKKYNFQRFQITLDGHRERHNQVRYISKVKGSYDEIVKNIKLLIKHELNVVIRINCSKETFENIENIAHDFQDISTENRRYMVFDFHEIWQLEEILAPAVEPVMGRFEDLGFRVANTNINVYRYVCYADRKYNACINYNGDVYKCTAKDFSKENKEGALLADGTIIWNDKYRIRIKSKRRNKPCLSCSIFPICGGGCSQQAMENAGRDYCIYGFDEALKKKSILDFFLNEMEEKTVV